MNCAVLCESTCCCRPESVEDNILNILDSPTCESKPFLSASSNQRVISLSFHLPTYFNDIYLTSFHCCVCVSEKSVSIPDWSVCRVTLLPHVSPSLFSVCLTSMACCSYQETELFEIIEKLQVSYSLIDLQCVYPVMCEKFSYHRCSSCPSGQQDRWAAMWIPSTSEG